MRKELKRIAAGLTAIATVGSVLLSAGSVHATAPTSTKDTLTREAVDVAATHTLVTTLPSFATGSYVVFDYAAAGFFLYASAPSCAIASGTCTAVTSTTSTTITCASGTCSGLLTLGTFAGDNPSSAGSKTIAITSDAVDPGISGSFAIPIVDSDQVTVTATVNASITFDIDTQSVSNSLPNTTETAAPYAVALGAITTSDSKASGTTDSVNYIMLDLDTNASGGAVVTVSSTNSSLKSTSTPADTISSANGTIVNGTENYGICVTATSATTGSFTEVAPFDDADCAGDDQTPTVGGLTGSAQDILNTGSNPIAVGRAQITVAAAISVGTDAHDDYTDILKFIATGTF